MKVPILMNSKAGLLKSTPGPEELRKVAESCDVDCEILLPESEAHLCQMIRDMVAKKVPRIAVAGGDGTIHSAVQCLAYSDTALGVLPQGTANNFSHALKLPQDLPSALRVLVEGQVRDVDLGSVGSTFFTESAGVGLFADALRIYGRSNKNPFKGIWVLLKLIFSLRAHRIRLLIDGEPVHEKSVFCECANSYRMAYSLAVAPGAKITDGELDVVVFGDLDRRELIPYYRALRAQVHPAMEKVSIHRGKTVQIEAMRPVTVHCDDRVVGKTPVTVKAERGALKVLVERL